jgi:hypothetical protein
MNALPSLNRLSISAWGPCPAEPPAEAVKESQTLQREVREAYDQNRGVIQLYVAPDTPGVEPDRKLAAS